MKQQARNLILTTEAAQLCSVAPETIRQWERDGILPALKTGRGVRLFDRDDVERIARNREQRGKVRSSEPMANPIAKEA